MNFRWKESIRSIFTFKRIPTSGRWYREVDGIRFVAIALALVHHIVS